jgi:hypothetical protein
MCLGAQAGEKRMPDVVVRSAGFTRFRRAAKNVLQIWFTKLDRKGASRMTNTLNLAGNQQPTPERIFTRINSYQLTEAIKSAIE